MSLFPMMGVITHEAMVGMRVTGPPDFVLVCY